MQSKAIEAYPNCDRQTESRLVHSRPPARSPWLPYKEVSMAPDCDLLSAYVNSLRLSPTLHAHRRPFDSQKVKREILFLILFTSRRDTMNNNNNNIRQRVKPVFTFLLLSALYPLTHTRNRERESERRRGKRDGYRKYQASYFCRLVKDQTKFFWQPQQGEWAKGKKKEQGFCSLLQFGTVNSGEKKAKRRRDFLEQQTLKLQVLFSFSFRSCLCLARVH